MKKRASLISLAITSLLIAAMAISVNARRVSLKADAKAMKREHKLSEELRSQEYIVAHVIEHSGDDALKAVIIYGYDKPHAANKESLFVSSALTDETIDSLRVEIAYNTMDGYTLHTRAYTLRCHILPGQSQRIEYPSWDSTHTFYYHATPPARKEGLNPYQVLIRPCSVFTHRD